MKKEKTLELTLKISADEAVLREIQDKLMNTNTLRLPLTDLLADWVKEWLMIAGVSRSFKVEVQSDQFVSCYSGEPGFSASALMEAQQHAHRVANGLGGYHDYSFSQD
jgi:hypothetical protein